MRVLLDTDVVLDVIMGREPFAKEAAEILDSCATAINLEGIVTRNLKDYKNATLPVFLQLTSSLS